MAVVFVYGGVGPEDVLRGYIVLIAAALGLGSFGLLCSSLVEADHGRDGHHDLRRPRDDGRDGLRPGLLAAMGTFDDNGNRVGGLFGIRSPAILAYINPFIAQADVMCGTADRLRLRLVQCRQHARRRPTQGVVFSDSSRSPDAGAGRSSTAKPASSATTCVVVTPRSRRRRGLRAADDRRRSSRSTCPADDAVAQERRDLARPVGRLHLLSVQAVSPTRRWQSGRGRAQGAEGRRPDEVASAARPTTRPTGVAARSGAGHPARPARRPGGPAGPVAAGDPGRPGPASTSPVAAPDRPADVDRPCRDRRSPSWSCGRSPGSSRSRSRRSSAARDPDHRRCWAGSSPSSGRARRWARRRWPSMPKAASATASRARSNWRWPSRPPPTPLADDPRGDVPADGTIDEAAEADRFVRRQRRDALAALRAAAGLFKPRLSRRAGGRHRWSAALAAGAGARCCRTRRTRSSPSSGSVARGRGPPGRTPRRDSPRTSTRRAPRRRIRGRELAEELRELARQLRDKPDELAVNLRQIGAVESRGPLTHRSVHGAARIGA